MEFVFIVKDRGIVSPSDLDYERFNSGHDSDLASINEDAQKTYGDNYLGMFDYFVFDVNGEKIKVLSKCSYEIIWNKYNKIRKDKQLKFDDKVLDQSYIFGEKEEKGNLNRRKLLRMSYLVTAVAFNPNEETSYKSTLEQKATEFQTWWLFHDIMANTLNILYYQLQARKQSIKELEKMLEAVNYYRQNLESHNLDNPSDMNLEAYHRIINHIKKEIETYKQKSFADKLFKKF